MREVSVTVLVGHVPNDFRTHCNLTVEKDPSGSGRAVSEVSLTQMPWNFKIFYGLLLDRITFFGSRRKGWNLGCSYYLWLFLRDQAIEGFKW